MEKRKRTTQHNRLVMSLKEFSQLCLRRNASEDLAEGFKTMLRELAALEDALVGWRVNDAGKEVPCLSSFAHEATCPGGLVRGDMRVAIGEICDLSERPEEQLTEDQRMRVRAVFACTSATEMAMGCAALYRDQEAVGFFPAEENETEYDETPSEHIADFQGRCPAEGWGQMMFDLASAALRMSADLTMVMVRPLLSEFDRSRQVAGLVVIFLEEIRRATSVQRSACWEAQGIELHGYRRVVSAESRGW